ncbi:MAG: glycoside hydrolase family 43 protein [Chitinophagaceae bacterium]
MQFKIFILLFLLVSTIECSKNSSPNPPPPPAQKDSTFTNPLLSSGPDPWVIQKDTNYYFTNTFGNKIAIYKTSKMSELKNTSPITIFTPPTTGPYSKDIWAPEIHYLQNKWYVYFAADDGDNANHRIYVLENASSDPLSGTWTLKGKISDSTNKWAIDASEFDYNGQEYLIWSGWEGDINVQQNIYIAKLLNPWTIEGNRVMISAPTYNWEKVGSSPGTFPTVNEGPEAIENSSGQLFLTFSASGCWTDGYCLGLLSLKVGGDPLNAADWTKKSTPVFVTNSTNGAYAPGHNGFFISRDGTQNWIIYHANSFANQGCGNSRNPRMQQFTWNTDGSPNFGTPVAISIKITKPSGEY